MIFVEICKIPISQTGLDISDFQKFFILLQKLLFAIVGHQSTSSSEFAKSVPIHAVRDRIKQT